MSSSSGEVFKLSPPVSGEVLLTVPADRAGGAFSVGLETLEVGRELYAQRLLKWDKVLVTVRGQGTVRMDGAGATQMLLPGAIVYVPRQTWYRLHNTGTGMLKLAWVVAPGGIEAYYRELGQVADLSDLDAVQQIAKRHGVELSAGELPLGQGQAPRRRRRSRRRGRGRTSPADSSSRSTLAHVPSASEPGAQEPSGAPAGPAKGQRGRRRRGGRRSQASKTPQTGATAKPSTGHVPAAPKQARTQRPARPDRGRGRGRRSRFTKEVYMGGHWVKVEGEGPVIA